MNNQGFIKLPRAIMEQSWYRNNNARLLFFHLLLTANFVDDSVARRGEVATSYQSLASEVGLTIQQLRTALAVLIKAGMITRQVTRRSTSLRTVITVCHYDTYQGRPTRCQHDGQQQQQQQPQEKKESIQRKKRSKEEILEEATPSVNKKNIYSNAQSIPTIAGSYSRLTKEQANQYALDTLQAWQREHEARRRASRQ